MKDIDKINHIHFIGIGGIGNSALAEILLNAKHKITGSDLKKSNLTEKLESKGATIFYEHKKENVDGADLIVFSSAVGEENVERIAAKEQNIPEINRAQMLGILMDRYKNSIAISGTHGKTTTTSLITILLKQLGYDPTALIGGTLKEIDGNVRIGESQCFITEACEYKENFLNLKPRYGLILNIEEDHLDYFEDLEEIISSFVKFGKNIHPKGALIINNDDFNTKRLYAQTEAEIITVGINQKSDYQAKNITYDNNSFPSFDIFKDDELLTNCSLNIPGTHNIYNALASIAVVHQFHDDIEAIVESLSSFTGVNRRFEILGKYKEAVIIDDYAHHPTEIKATLSTAKKIKDKKIRCVFQPHTYTRTASLLHEFGNAFDDADEIIITDIYAAREKDDNKVHSKDLVNEIKKVKKNVKYMPTLEEIIDYYKKTAEENDLIISLGAGNIRVVTEKLI